MPPRRRRAPRRKRNTDYEADFDQDEPDFSEDESLFLMLNMCIELSKRRKSAGGRKRASTSTSAAGGGPSTSGPKTKRLRKNKIEPAASQAKAEEKPSTSMLDLESDDEDPVAKQEFMNNIDNKVNDFFKNLESDEEDTSVLETKDKSAKNRKPKDFYALSSDSEDDKSNDNTATNIPVKLELPLIDNSNEQKEEPNQSTDDVFAYVDNILKDSSTDSKKETFSLADLKKKTSDILGEISGSLKDIQGIPHNTLDTQKEAPTCPVCLDEYGTGRQSMATLCGHIFCKLCLDQIGTSTKKCPTCRKPINKGKYHPIYI